MSNTPDIEVEKCFSQLRLPKRRNGVSYSTGAEDRIIQRLKRIGIDVFDYIIDVDGYHRYFSLARYATDFSEYYKFNLAEKSLEHYLASTFLKLNEGDIYIDIASEHSPVPVIYDRLFGVKAYRQDLMYPPGLNGDQIGGDAAQMPIPPEFSTKMALHCSFEHFENDSDIRFIREAERVLKPGGLLCVVPLYLSEEYAVQTDPVIAMNQNVEFEDDAILCCAIGWGNRHGRFYDPEHFQSRIAGNLGHLDAKVFRILNSSDVDSSCYARFLMVIQKIP